MASCPECWCDRLLTDPGTGEITCEKCGTVIIERGLKTEPEEGERAVVTSLIYAGHGISSSIPGKDEYTFKLRRYDKTATTNETKSRIVSVTKVIMTYADALNLPRVVVETAIFLYRKANKEGLLYGRHLKTVIPALLFAACRVHNVPHDLKEILALTGARKKLVIRFYYILQDRLHLKPRPDPTLYIQKIADAVGLNGQVIELAERIVNEKKKDMFCKNPVVTAAAAVYLACRKLGLDVQQKEIAKAANVTTVAIRYRTKQLLLQ